jgi:IQ calmodulin-binding motif
MVYRDYVSFVERTGHQPVRMIVERNIKEVAERIEQIAYDLLVLIQRHWRGVIARRTVSYFKTEIIRIRQYEVAQVLKIQRVYRGYHCRLTPHRILKAVLFDESIMDKYIEEEFKKKIISAKKDLDQLILVNYRDERRKEATLRYTSRIKSPRAYDGKKMKAYSASCYGETYLEKHVIKSVRDEREAVVVKDKQHREEHERKLFIMKRIAEYGPKGFGMRSVPCAPPHRLATVIGSMNSSLSSMNTSLSQQSVTSVSTRRGGMGGIIESSRSRGMRAYFSQELQKIVGKEIEYVTHDHSRKDLLSRFKEYNKSTVSVEDGSITSGSSSSSRLLIKKCYKYPSYVTDLPNDLLRDEVDDLVSSHNKQLEDGKRRRKNRGRETASAAAIIASS